MVSTKQLHFLEMIDYLLFAAMHVIFSAWNQDVSVTQKVFIYAVGMSLLTAGCLIVVNNEFYKQIGYALCVMLGVHLIGTAMGSLAFGICIFMAAGTVLSIYGERKLNYYYLIIVNLTLAFDLIMEYDVITSEIPINYYIMMILTCEIYLVTECFMVILYQQKVEEIQIQNELLNIAQKSKDEFLANMSHEIRTPMNAIVGMSELIIREEEDNPKVSQYCHNIQSSGNNLLAIINDILDFSKIESGKMSISYDSYSIATAVNEVVGTAMFRRGYKDIAIIVDMDPNIPKLIDGDDIRMRQVLTNILTNAVKFTDYGYVYVQVGCYVAKDKNWLKVRVRDSGIGIKKDDLAHLFESFRRFDTKKNRSIEGTGLGLPICKRLVELMNGTIRIQSEYGKGTTVTIDIPQQIIDDTPSLILKDKDVKVVIFLMPAEETDERREELYYTAAENMWKKLNVYNENYSDFEQFSEAVEKNTFTHAIIGLDTYMNNRRFIDELSEKIKVYVLCEPGYVFNLGDEIHVINLPFSAVSVVAAFNGEAYYNGLTSGGSIDTSFTAPKANVLVVDDNDLNRKVAEGILRIYNVNCIVVKGGREAINILKEKSVDIVFMDHMMPELDGVETTKLIRQSKDEEYRNIPIIAMTANVVNDSKQMFLKNGFQDFLPKPVKVNDMGVILKRWLPEELIIYDGDEYKREDPDDENVKKTMESMMEMTGKKDLKTIPEESDREETVTSNDKIILNESVALENMGGQRGLYKELLEYCLELEQQRWSDIQEMYEKKDWEEYTILIHALKGGMRSLGADELAMAAQEQEKAGKEKRIDDILAGHEPLKELYDRTHRSIEEHLKTFEVNG